MGQNHWSPQRGTANQSFDLALSLAPAPASRARRNAPCRQDCSLSAALTRQEVDEMPPAQRERFAQLCEHWAKFARLRPDAPKSGVLVELRTRRP
jgi:hypothetical protein